MAVHIRGRDSQWAFNFHGDPKHLESWRSDGLEIYIVENVIPQFVVNLGLTRAFCILQDLWNFKTPWGSGQ